MENLLIITAILIVVLASVAIINMANRKPPAQAFDYERIEPEVGDTEVVTRTHDRTKMSTEMLHDLAHCFNSMRNHGELSLWDSAEEIRDYMNHKYNLNKSTRTYYNYQRNIVKYMEDAAKRENKEIVDETEEHF